MLQSNNDGNQDGSELLRGTLDLLILKTLVGGARHGYGIAQHLKLVSEEVLQVGESSLYPALQRLLLRGWVKAEWGASENNRRERYYTLTAAGRNNWRSNIPAPLRSERYRKLNLYPSARHVELLPNADSKRHHGPLSWRAFA